MADLDTQSPPFSRAEKLWFDDGNIVVLTGDSLAFKVYKGVLRSASPVFRDMLDIPPPEDAEHVEGCPVVRVPDSGLDIQRFFKWLFHVDRESLAAPARPVSASILASLLRIAHKYKVGDVVDLCRSRLELRLKAPMSFADNTKLSSWGKIHEWMNHGRSKVVVSNYTSAIEIVNLIRVVNGSATRDTTTFGNAALAVALFYCCVAFEEDPNRLWDGVVRDDGRVEQLSRGDRERCIRGIQFIRDETRQAIGDAMETYRRSFDQWKDKVCTRGGGARAERWCLNDVCHHAVRYHVTDRRAYTVKDAWVNVNVRGERPAICTSPPWKNWLCKGCEGKFLKFHYEALTQSWGRIEAFLLRGVAPSYVSRVKIVV